MIDFSLLLRIGFEAILENELNLAANIFAKWENSTCQLQFNPFKPGREGIFHFKFKLKTLGIFSVFSLVTSKLFLIDRNRKRMYFNLLFIVLSLQIPVSNLWSNLDRDRYSENKMKLL